MVWLLMPNVEMGHYSTGLEMARDDSRSKPQS